MSTRTTTRPLTRFWLALERLPGAAAVAAEWRARVGTDFELARPFLAPDPELASSYPRLGGVGVPYRVVPHGADDIVGVAEDGDTVPLRREDLVVHRLDPPALARAVAGAFGFEPDGGPVEGLAGTFRVGLYRPAAGVAFPTYLTIQLEPRDYRAAVDSLAARAPGPFLVFAPTSLNHRAQDNDLLTGRASAFVPLADAVLPADGGRLVASEAGLAWLEEFCSRAAPDSRRDATRVSFPTPAGARWADVRIGFLDGHRVTVKVGAVHRTLNYTQMGMVDGRSGNPTVQWELLRAFARGRGTLTWKSPDADPKNQKRKELLAEELRAFFRIPGEPIDATDEGDGWRTVFVLVPD